MYLAEKVQNCILKVSVDTFAALFSTKNWEDTKTKKGGTRPSETLFSVLIKHVHFHPFLQTFILFRGITCGRLNSTGSIFVLSLYRIRLSAFHGIINWIDSLWFRLCRKKSRDNFKDKYSEGIWRFVLSWAEFYLCL